MVDQRFFNNYGPFSLEEIAKFSDSEIYIANTVPTINLTQRLFYGVAPMDLASNIEITVLNNKKYSKDLAKTLAGACFITQDNIKYAPANMILLISKNPYKSYALTTTKFYPEEDIVEYISPHAFIDETAIIGTNSRIEANVFIGENAVIGSNSIIGSGSYIGKSVHIGNSCKISSNVTITHTIMGDNNIIHTGARIGQDGFGFASDMKGHYKVSQLGRVLIGSNVEIGANTCIDRGSGHDTIISDYCMIDNLVQIGHNVQIGKACIIVAQVGIAGSTKIGDFVVVGGQVGISGHLTIGSYSQIAAGSGVIKDIEPKQIYGGYPAVPVKTWHKQSIILKKLANNGNHNE
ncbi:MAG: UDP-3-O-(3-hydroxymyristoyl)glucosamine N-acyltransferase [Alphaproteobacteria bacterium]